LRRRELFEGLAHWYGRLLGWAEAFREADDYGEQRAGAIECIRECCRYAALSFARITSAADPFIEYEPNDQMLGFCAHHNNPNRINALDRDLIAGQARQSWAQVAASYTLALKQRR